MNTGAMMANSTAVVPSTFRCIEWRRLRTVNPIS
jgi:hypothetical protein